MYRTTECKALSDRSDIDLYACTSRCVCTLPDFLIWFFFSMDRLYMGP